MTNDVTVVEQLLNKSYNLFKTSSTPEKKQDKLIESQLVGRSPKTLALMKNEMEIDLLKEIEEKKCNHLKIVEKLKTFELSFQQSTDENTEELKVKKNMLEKAVASSEEDIQRFYKDAQATSNKFDEFIIAANEKELEDINEASKSFKRIVVELKSGETSIVRKFKPLKSFSDLQLRVEALNPDFKCVLTLPNSREFIGSQEELLFAYQDAKDCDVLTLELELYAKKEKRKIDCVEELEGQVINHSGKWMPSEVALFKVGVQQCGWGNWKRISEVVDTRTTDQVKTFSKTQAGKSVKTELNFMPTLSKLADGLFEVSKNVSRLLENAENSEIKQKDSRVLENAENSEIKQNDSRVLENVENSEIKQND